MLDDLALRANYWKDSLAPYQDRHDLADSIPYPYAGLEHLFDGKDVLEIGPGRGRQYVNLRKRVDTYSLCDIVHLDKVMYGEDQKYWITDYDIELSADFDVIHFWYVIHHIKLDELPKFFKFLWKHLRLGGIILFNTPWLGNERKWYVGDGIGTTYIDKDTIIDFSYSWFNIFHAAILNERSCGYVFGLRKYAITEWR